MFDSNGYLDIINLIETTNPYVFIVGARGIGKTFGILKYLLSKALTEDKKFIYLRRSETELDFVATEEGNPFTPINNYLKLEHPVEVRKMNKVMRGFYVEDKCIGYILALSTFYSKRSISFDDIDYLFYDEFIPELNARQIKHEAEAFFNTIETIARNREGDKNREPLKVICASNSNTLDNPIFIELGIVNKALKMVNKKQSRYDDSRGFTLFMPFNSPISKMKEKHSLYKLTTNSTNFRSMSLKNEWNDEVSENVISKNLKQFTPLVHVGELYIYKHKVEKKYYVTEFKTGTFQKNYSTGQIDLLRFKKDFVLLWFAYMGRRIYFESYSMQLIFEKYFDTKK